MFTVWAILYIWSMSYLLGYNLVWFLSESLSQLNVNLTQWTRICSRVGFVVSIARLPVMSSRRTTPKQYMSDIFVSLPLMAYSGAQYPYVPITLVVTWLLSPTGPSFARPKSANFALKLPSKRIFDALRSRYITGGLATSCKYSRPLAAPTATFIRVCQDSGWDFGVRSVEFKYQMGITCKCAIVISDQPTLLNMIEDQ